MTYGVEITETLQRVVYVETDSANAAVYKVNEMVDAGCIVLGSDDFAGREIRIYSEEKN